MASESTVYEIGDTLLVEYLTGTPIKATIDQRMTLAEIQAKDGEAYDMWRRHYPDLQMDDHLYRVKNNGETLATVCHENIFGKVQAYQPNYTHRARTFIPTPA